MIQIRSRSWSISRFFNSYAHISEVSRSSTPNISRVKKWTWTPLIGLLFCMSPGLRTNPHIEIIYILDYILDLPIWDVPSLLLPFSPHPRSKHASICTLLSRRGFSIPFFSLGFSFLFCFFIPFIIFNLLLSLSLLVATQIWGHIAGSSPPLPTTVCALQFYREKISALSSPVDSRRIVLSHARRSQQLNPFLLFAHKSQHLTMVGFELQRQH